MKARCSHCNLSYDENIMIKDEDKLFCCKGCQGIYHLLKQEGLDSFYEKLGKNSLQPPSELKEDLSKFDLEGFAKKYIKQKDGLSEISLIIEGIHCSACVWLNEKVLFQTDGIIQASVNATTNKAKITWDNEQISLSKIIEKIHSIGYKALPYDPNLQEEQVNARRKEYYIKLLVGIFATMNMMWIAVAQYAGYFSGMEQGVKSILNFSEFILATPTLFYTGAVFFKGAYYGLKNRFINMDFLVATGASLAYVFSIYAMFSRTSEVYFDSVTMIITFVFAGKYLEILAKKKAVDSLDSMMGSLPTEVCVIKNEKRQMCLVELVNINDIIEVKAGEKIVIDGIITNGKALIDESSLTGESKPIFKEKADVLLSGSVCLDSLIRYKATATYQNSMLFQIVTLLEDSTSKKPKIEQIANKISGYFSLIILLIAAITFLAWLNLGFVTALIVSISVIVVACPCALGLATPVSTLVGLGVGARHGILFKEASFLETMAKCDTLVLDKTGTITIGKPKVVNFQKMKEFDPNLLYSLLKTSSHPVSLGIIDFLEEKQSFESLSLENIKNIESKGVSAELDGLKLKGGSIKLMNENLDESGDFTSYYFSVNDEICAKFELQDKPKEYAKEVIKKLNKLGIKTIMLTGDNKQAAQDIAKQIGIEEVHSSLLPIDKANIVENLRAKNHIVVMAGDGINDALALSKSNIAIAMGSGADISISVSDIILPSNSLLSLQYAFELSRKTFSIVKQNLAFSLLYNAVAIPIAIMGYIIPLFAALFMSLSSLSVILNSLRIKNTLKGKK